MGTRALSGSYANSFFRWYCRQKRGLDIAARKFYGYYLRGYDVTWNGQGMFN